ncbi:MAG: hypothetical protein JXA57_08750 [Armatimonadetes bacterium]|nr:hypothetical protein [Armatimonadota bacterium]
MKGNQESPTPTQVSRRVVVTDIGLVAFLQMRGLAFTVDRSGFPHKFVFADAAKAEELSQSYWDRSSASTVPAQAFMVALQGVKSQIFRRGQNSGRRLDIDSGRRTLAE